MASHGKANHGKLMAAPLSLLQQAPRQAPALAGAGDSRIALSLDQPAFSRLPGGAKATSKPAEAG